ncbi:MAG: nucleotide-binding universal stress UspA family protein [Paraglaciecola sp.]|jgi:nucleotide-binding universal stress UspA family protein
MLAPVIETQAHAVNTFEPPGINLASPSVDLPGLDYGVLRQKIIKHHTEKMHTLLTNNGFLTEHMHLVEGQAETAIQQFSKKLKTQLVVQGTVRRTGLAATFIGNTAENILAGLTCEILTIKPDVKGQ